ncbi:MAG: hypothetical protein ABJE95_24170 [Byssovorax sp.]
MTSRLGPVVGIPLLAVATLFVGTANAGPCTPVRIERGDATFPFDWSRAMTELMEATSVEGQAWSCTGGVLTVSVDPSGTFATLSLADASGRLVERRIPRALDLVPSAKALLAAPAADVVPTPTPSPEAEMKHAEPLPIIPPPTVIPPAEPRFFVDALLGARYRNPESAVWGAATVRAMIPFGGWSGGFWLRGGIPASLEHRDDKQHNHTSSEATLGVSGGRRLVNGALQLHLTIDPSITFAFEPSATNVPTGQSGPHDELAVRIHPQIGLGLRGSFPLAGPLRGSVALDGEFLPDTIGGGLSLGVEAVIR